MINSYLFLAVGDGIPVGIQDTQEHDASVLASLRNDRQTYYLLINGASDVNEDATAYNNVEERIMPTGFIRSK